MDAVIHYDPVEAFQRLRSLPNPVFFDSSRFDVRYGRYSFLSADPIKKLTLGRDFKDCNPWNQLSSWLKPFERILEVDENVPHGFVAGFFGYDLGSWVDRSPQDGVVEIEFPHAWLGCYDVVLVFDHLKKQARIISTGVNDEGRVDSDRARQRFKLFQNTLLDPKTRSVGNQSWRGYLCPRMTRDEYEARVEKIRSYIRKGDVYQVNLTRALVGKFEGDPVSLYDDLRRVNPAINGGYLDFDEGRILSVSPERFLRMKGRTIQTRPIKGTSARTGNPEEDQRLRERLLTSGKDRAELMMITDLLRNDLGRVAEFGSVSVPELVTCETSETVFHLVSTVEARLREGLSHLETIKACFPGGSITGAPKLRAMELIHELEKGGRGAYTGIFGYFGFNQVSDFNILIRTLFIQSQTQQMGLNVGCGIVSDSDPRLEYEETLHKAEGIFRAGVELRECVRRET